MLRKVAMAIMALSVGGCFILTSPPVSAQLGQPQQQWVTAQQGQAPRWWEGRRTACRQCDPRGHPTRDPHGHAACDPHSDPKGDPHGHPARAQATRTVTPRATRTVTPKATRTVTPRATRTVTPKATRTVTPRATRTVTPRGTRAVTGGRLRGVSRAAIQGHNYSVWRGSHRVRYGGRWRTFGALSLLGAIIIGSDQYYPYAYISAPENYCEGLTEDGCELMWEDVQTIEGDVVPQCVAYCPWQ